jgi:hypothetical protein
LTKARSDVGTTSWTGQDLVKFSISNQRVYGFGAAASQAHTVDHYFLLHGDGASQTVWDFGASVSDGGDPS